MNLLCKIGIHEWEMMTTRTTHELLRKCIKCGKEQVKINRLYGGSSWYNVPKKRRLIK